MAHAVNYMQLQSCLVLWQFLMIKQNLCSCLDEIHSYFGHFIALVIVLNLMHKETVGTLTDSYFV